ncbi:hypothetical protein BDV26DRAFT_277609 [Aspergillus bertholletiae]|uniref:Restriction endonuclease domain-containing protein n=1 Tax=Aspergillus bertholletiae TaxID=1226010 RepID=A0A5N7BMV7_9EURO|nr:hypothetical protein BDV26DRAFT_277609 [Aspergillus bertholletiae]
MPLQPFTVLPSSQLAMTELFPPRAYTNLRDVSTIIFALKKQLESRDVSQYISLKNVSASNFRYIDQHLPRLCGKVKVNYYPDIVTLIIKVPTNVHEIVHTNIGEEVILQCRGMGIGRAEFLGLGATRYTGPTASNKEADASWKNPTLRPKHVDWPMLVIEVGVSESMPRLRNDAAWWISNSGGQVRIVIVIKVTRATKKVVIEKYIPKQVVLPRTRARARLPPVYAPDLVSTTTVDQGAHPPTVGGDRLILEFESVIGRAPMPPERDIELTPVILLDATRYVFVN